MLTTISCFSKLVPRGFVGPVGSSFSHKSTFASCRQGALGWVVLGSNSPTSKLVWFTVQNKVLLLHHLRSLRLHLVHRLVLEKLMLLDRPLKVAAVAGCRNLLQHQQVRPRVCTPPASWQQQ